MKFLCAHILSVSILFAQSPSSLLEEFREAKGELLHTVLVNRESTATTRTQDFLLITTNADTVRGRVRFPKTSHGRFPAALLVVGIETGKDVVQLIEGRDSVIAVGIDYPFKGPYDFEGWNAVNTVFALRETGFKTVPQILICLDWLFHHPLVDTTDVTLIAVSFGVFTALPAAVLEHRIKRLVIVQAGGDVAEVIAANARRLSVPLPSWLAGWLGGWILAPFEPNRYVGDVAPRPVLLVSGASDEFFPSSSVKSLYDHANDPKEWIQHKSGHVMPGEKELIQELTGIVADRLYGTR